MLDFFCLKYQWPSLTFYCFFMSFLVVWHLFCAVLGKGYEILYDAAEHLQVSGAYTSIESKVFANNRERKSHNWSKYSIQHNVVSHLS